MMGPNDFRGLLQGALVPFYPISACFSMQIGPSLDTPAEGYGAYGNGAAIDVTMTASVYGGGSPCRRRRLRFDQDAGSIISTYP